MWRCAAAIRRARTKPIEFKEGHAGSAGRQGAARAQRHRRALRRRRRALSLAGQPDVEDALRRLRPPGARQGMVGRRRGGGGMASHDASPPRARRAARRVRSGRVGLGRANAGSGKTHVLAQRVIRLLLRGTPPEKILCLTYHQGGRRQHGEPRVRRRSPNGPRSTTTRSTRRSRRSRAAGRTPARRAHARRLFAQALETPGGLKVQTIHAFCTRLLHQFPFEADVAARFEVLEERAQSELIDRLRMARAARSRRASRTARSAARSRSRSRSRRTRRSPK